MPARTQTIQTIDPIEFCPAAACAAEVVRIERSIEHVSRLLTEAEAARGSALLSQLDEVMDDLILAADEARNRLAQVEAVSSAGAMAQLLAAVRDTRVRDDAELTRAKDLEAKAVRFLAAANLFNARFCKTLSGSKLGGRTHVPPPRDAVQHTS